MESSSCARLRRKWVEPLRAGVDALMADPSPPERTVRPTDGSAPFFRTLQLAAHCPFREFVMRRRASSPRG
jgi:hypothetical protein